MSINKAISANTVKNNGATIFNGGNVNLTTGHVTQTLGLGFVGYRSGKHGAMVPQPLDAATMAANAANDPLPVEGRSQSPTWKAVDSFTFAKMHPRAYVAMLIGDSLGGQPTTILRIPAADINRRSIHKITGIRTSFLYSWEWVSDSEGGITLNFVYSNRTPVQNFYGNDVAASPTRALPGKFVFHDGSKTIQQANYPPKS